MAPALGLKVALGVEPRVGHRPPWRVQGPGPSRAPGPGSRPQLQEIIIRGATAGHCSAQTLLQDCRPGSQATVTSRAPGPGGARGGNSSTWQKIQLSAATNATGDGGQSQQGACAPSSSASGTPGPPGQVGVETRPGLPPSVRKAGMEPCRELRLVGLGCPGQCGARPRGPQRPADSHGMGSRPHHRPAGTPGRRLPSGPPLCKAGPRPPTPGWGWALGALTRRELWHGGQGPGPHTAT